jgi:hypothetical protein
MQNDPTHLATHNENTHSFSDGCCAYRCTIEAPEDFVFKRTGTPDSFMGTLTRKSDGFTITFDVGWASGMIMHESRKAKRTYLRKHRIGGLSASTGIEDVVAGQVFANVPEGQLIATTVNDDSKTKRDRDPANFWAPIRTNSDIADFLLIVSTYKSKPTER